MPFYQYRCSECSQTLDEYFQVKNYQSTVQCRICKGVAMRVFTPIAFDAGILEPYWDYGLGQMISNKVQRRSLIQERDLVEIGTESPEVFEKIRQKNEKEAGVKRRQEASEVLESMKNQQEDADG